MKTAKQILDKNNITDRDMILSGTIDEVEEAMKEYAQAVLDELMKRDNFLGQINKETVLKLKNELK